jgi:hypothetical protein
MAFRPTHHRCHAECRPGARGVPVAARPEWTGSSPRRPFHNGRHPLLAQKVDREVKESRMSRYKWDRAHPGIEMIRTEIRPARAAVTQHPI